MKLPLVTLATLASLALSPLLFAETPSELPPLLQPFVDKHDIAGVRQMKPDSIFWIASQVKPMTAVPMERYLPPAKDLALVWMVQHNGFPCEGGKAQEGFKCRAITSLEKP